MDTSKLFGCGERRAREVGPPTDDEVKALLVQISKRMLYTLSKKGYYTIDENIFNWEEDLFLDEEPMLASCLAASIRYRIALGERAGEQIRRALSTWPSVFLKRPISQAVDVRILEGSHSTPMWQQKPMREKSLKTYALNFLCSKNKVNLPSDFLKDSSSCQ